MAIEIQAAYISVYADTHHALFVPV